MKIQAAAATHPELSVVFADAAQDNQKQVSQVENFLTQGIDLLIISPNEAAPLTDVVAKVYEKGIPVIVLDRKVNGDKYTMWIGANNQKIGERAGEEFHTLTTQEMPQHFHFMQAYNGNADTGAAAVPPTNNSFANNAFAVPAGGGSTPVNRYSNAAPTGSLLNGAISLVGGSQAHENRQPYGVVNFCIALVGVFPSQN